MKRSGINGTGDALDLFLDTICNAFGGIIFISLLVCVMLQLTSKAQSVPEDPRQKPQLESIKKEIERIEGDLKRQENQILALRGNIDQERLAEYRQRKKDVHRLQKENEDLEKEIRDTHRKRRDQENRVAAATRENQEVTKEEESLQEELEELKKRRGVNLSVPGERNTEKKGVPILLSGGRLTFVQQYNDAGEAIGVNPDITCLEVPGQVSGRPEHAISPKEGKGLRFTGAEPLGTPEEHKKRLDALEAALRPLLKKFTPRPVGGKLEKDCHYIEIAVWPDSFSQFEVLRDLLLRLGFEYNVVLVETGKPIRAGGGARHVQ